MICKNTPVGNGAANEKDGRYVVTFNGGAKAQGAKR